MVKIVEDPINNVLVHCTDPNSNSPKYIINYLVNPIFILLILIVQNANIYNLGKNLNVYDL